MKAARYLGVAAIAALLVLVLIACSNASRIESDEPDAAPPTTVPAEASSESGSSDGSPGPDVDGPKPMCTDEGWCHTVVPDGQTLRDVWGDGQGVVWTVSEQGNILRWDETAWVNSYSAGVPLYAIWGSSPTDLWAGGGESASGDLSLPGILLHGTGASASTITWNEVPSPATIRSIWGTSATDVWAVASRTDRILVSDPSFVIHHSGSGADTADAGTGWEVDPISTTSPMQFQKVWGTSNDDVWLSGRVAVGNSRAEGRVFHRRRHGDGGLSWRLEQPPPETNSITYKGIVWEITGASISRNLVLLIRFTRADSAYYHRGVSNDDGATFTWTQRSTDDTGLPNYYSYNMLSVVWSSSPDDIWMAGELGRLRHWDGVKWRFAAIALDNMPVQNPINAIWGSGADGDVWAVGADIALRRVAHRSGP